MKYPVINEVSKAASLPVIQAYSLGGFFDLGYRALRQCLGPCVDDGPPIPRPGVIPPPVVHKHVVVRGVVHLGRDDVPAQEHTRSVACQESVHYAVHRTLSARKRDLVNEERAATSDSRLSYNSCS